MQCKTTIMRDRQRAIRREIDRRAIPLKQVSFDSGITMNTLLSYFPGGEREPAVIPMSAVFSLLEGNALPLDLIGLMLPTGIALVHVPEGIDFDDIESGCRAFLEAKGNAHGERSPAGRDLSDCEQEALGMKIVQLRGKVA